MSSTIPFAYGAFSSIAIAMTSIFIYMEDPTMRMLFAVLLGLYIFVHVIFFLNIEQGTWRTFFWQGGSWAACLCNELWNFPFHSAPDWGIPELNANHDANHAMHIVLYRHCDLPWEKIKDWLRDKKQEFLDDPPLWMSVKWFDELPANVKDAVWTQPGQLTQLLDKVKEVTKKEEDENM